MDGKNSTIYVKYISNVVGGVNPILTEDYHNFDEIYISLSLAEYGITFKLLTKDTYTFSKSLPFIFNLGNDNYHAWGAIKFTGNQTLYIEVRNIAGWGSGSFITYVYGIKYN